MKRCYVCGGLLDRSMPDKFVCERLDGFIELVDPTILTKCCLVCLAEAVLFAPDKLPVRDRIDFLFACRLRNKPIISRVRRSEYSELQAFLSKHKDNGCSDQRLLVMMRMALFWAHRQAHLSVEPTPGSRPGKEGAAFFILESAMWRRVRKRLGIKGAVCTLMCRERKRKGGPVPRWFFDALTIKATVCGLNEFYSGDRFNDRYVPVWHQDLLWKDLNLYTAIPIKVRLQAFKGS